MLIYQGVREGNTFQVLHEGESAERRRRFQEGYYFRIKETESGERCLNILTSLHFLRRENNQMQQNAVNQQLSPQDYLDRYAVTTYFKDVITLVLENRPEDPLEFIAD